MPHPELSSLHRSRSGADGPEAGCGGDQTAKLGASPLWREVLERGLRAARDLIDGFDLIATLVGRGRTS